MAYLPELHRCCVCGVDLGPENGDGICCDCEGADVNLTIISGGQAGVDRAALDVALERGLRCGGWVPKGRLAEDGPVPDRYPLEELPSADYPTRTRYNVARADAVLVLTTCAADAGGGTGLTVREARRRGTPCLVAEMTPTMTEVVRGWLAPMIGDRLLVLMVAGPRESKRPGIGATAAAFLRRVFDRIGVTYDGLADGATAAKDPGPAPGAG